MTDKVSLRTFFRDARAALSDDAKKASDAAICRHILDSSEYLNAQRILLYAAVRGEADLCAVAQSALSDGKEVAYPRTEGHGVMQFYPIRAFSDLTPGAMRIPEPPETTPLTAFQKTDLMLVPALAFDKDGYRLGWGGGYYDRYLRIFDGVKIGIARDGALLDTLPREAHDMAVDAIITEQKIYKVKL